MKAATRPAPTPPLAARPSRLSVTAIEDWLRDPYTIYAKYILRLQVLDAVDTPPGARDRGTVIHGAIGDFTSKFAAGLPANPIEELSKLGEKRFEPLADYLGRETVSLYGENKRIETQRFRRIITAAEYDWYL